MSHALHGSRLGPLIGIALQHDLFRRCEHHVAPPLTRTRQHTGIVGKGTVIGFFDQLLDRHSQIIRHLDREAAYRIRIAVASRTFGESVEIVLLTIEIQHRVIQFVVHRQTRRNRLVAVELDEPLRPVIRIGLLFGRCPAVGEQLFGAGIIHPHGAKPRTTRRFRSE